MERCDWGQACTILEEAVDTSETDIDARRHLAEALWKKGEKRRAVVQMEAAVQLDSRHAPTVVRSGEMLLEINATERALRRAQQAIALDPTLADAWSLRGRVFRKQGNEERALADLQQSLRYSPQKTTVLMEIAELQYTLGRPQRCLTTLHHMLDVYSTGETPQRALWLEGLSFAALERHDDAVRSLHAASQCGHPRADLLYQLAVSERASGRTEEATNTIRRALAIDAGHQASQVFLAQLQGMTAPGSSDVIRR